MTYTVKVLKEGYSKFENGVYKANGTSTLILGPKFKVVVDTLSAWDRELLLSALAEQGVSPGDITHVVNTHGHPDHVGNNNLFTGDNVIHVMGHAIHTNDTYFTDVSFQAGEIFNIDENKLQVTIHKLLTTVVRRTLRLSLVQVTLSIVSSSRW